MEEFFKNKHVYEVYFSGPQEEGLNSSSLYTDNFRNYSKKHISTLLGLCKKYDVKSNLLCNKVILSLDNFRKQFDYIHSLKGLGSVTIADPFQITKFKKEFPDLDIQASIIMGLDTFEKIERALSFGIGTVNVSGELNRNIPLLRSLKKLKKYYPEFRIKALANYICYYDCIFVTWHYVLPILDSIEIENKHDLFGPFANIDECRYCNPDIREWIRRPFIRPEDIDYYDQEGIDIFKIAFRNDESRVLKNTLRAYISKKYEGNLFDIIPSGNRDPYFYWDNKKFPQDFAKTVANCNKECKNCDYCNKVAKRVLIKK